MSSILDNPLDQRKSTSSGSMVGYHVEVRASMGTDIAFLIGETTVTSHWRKVVVRPGYPGVPIGKEYKEPILAMTDLVDYPCAQALRRWFVAMAERENKRVDTRIVGHKINWSWNAEPTRAIGEVTSEQVMFPEQVDPINVGK